MRQHGICQAFVDLANGDLLKYLDMPIDLECLDQAYRVAPVSADADQISLQIDGQAVSIPREAYEVAQIKILGPLINPSTADMVAIFITGAFNQFVGPRLQFEGKDNAQELIAQKLGIPIEELSKWQTVFDFEAFIAKGS